MILTSSMCVSEDATMLEKNLYRDYVVLLLKFQVKGGLRNFAGLL
jgi:hypothetical protein